MVLAITDDHRALAQSARGVVTSSEALVTARHSMDSARCGQASTSRSSELWKRISASDLLGLHIPEEFGGQGFGLPELAVVLEELGAAVASGPFLPTVIASAVIAEVGTDEQKRALLPGLCAGTLTAGVQVAEAGPRRPGARVLIAAEDPELLVLVEGDDLIVVDSVAADTLALHPLLDGTRPAQLLEPAALEGELLPGAASVLRRLTLVLSAAEAVGGMSACVDAAVAYAKTREQFGRPIGSFQAIKHHCANMLLDAQVSAGLVWDAARGADDPDEAALVAAMAASYAVTGYQRVAEKSIQVHGGIAFTWEHDAHLHLRRATAMARLLGAPDVLLQQVHALSARGTRRRHAVELPPEADAFRADVRAFRHDHEALSEPQRNEHFARSGYLFPHWPAPFGRDADPVEQLVIEEELAGVDRYNLGIGEWVVPTVLQEGTAEQVDRYIWPALVGTERWCQLFSEPGAGSDAAAVSTKAVRTEGGWLVTGQKVWTSDAQNSTHGLATIRTGPDKHRGITAMIIDMHTAGLEVRPLVEITGESMFNEVFFDEVFVPDDCVLGSENDGWRVAMAAFGNERVSIGEGMVTIEAAELVGLLEEYAPGDQGLAREVAALLVERHGISMLNVRQALRAVEAAGPGPEGNLAKGFQSEHAQRVAQLGMRITGPSTVVGEHERLLFDFLFTKCLTIAGGTSEIVRNQVAERLLGLPRELSIKPKERA